MMAVGNGRSHSRRIVLVLRGTIFSGVDLEGKPKKGGASPI